MKTIVLALSMLTLSCSGTVDWREGEGGEGDPGTSGSHATPVAMVCRPRAAATSAPMPTSAAVSLPAQPTAGDEASCRACNGEWGVHGIAEMESCNCRTCDGRKRCTDGADCQGMCIADVDNPEYELVEAGPPARGFLVGRCSDLVTVFGCNAHVDAGARASGPVSLAEPPPELCVD